jgi:hypothetical protein
MPKGKQPSLRDVLDEVRRNNELIQGREVIVEEMRAQNRATIEAVEASRVMVEERIDRFERATEGRFTVLEAAVRQNSTDIGQNSADIRRNSADILQNTTDIRQNSEDIRALSARVEALGSLDRRVSALEHRASREG